MNLKNTFLLLILSLFIMAEAGAQNLLSIKKNEFLNKNEKSQAAYTGIKKAMDLFEQEDRQINNCISLLLNANKINSSNAELNYNIGICYLESSNKPKALQYFLKAGEINPELSNDLYYFTGLSYQYRSQFMDAIKMFNKNIEHEINLRAAKNAVLIELCEKHIGECKNALHLQASPVNKKIIPLNDKVNSQYNDLNPIKKGNEFYFSSQRKSSAQSKKMERVYSLSKDSDGFEDFKMENIAIDNILNIALVDCIDNSTFAFYAGTDGGGDIYTASKKQGKWSAIQAISGVNTLSSREASACISGRELYFVSNRNGSYGECDIYYCTKIKGGKWSVPKNIGLHINTPFDEADVFVTANGKELFFNSKGHNSMGGYDIFKCDRLADGSWSNPVNMGSPINSPYNDIQYFKSAEGEAFFSSERDGGMGGYDIYAIEDMAPAKSIAKKDDAVKDSSLSKAKPVKKEYVATPPELIYRIQILACKNAAPADALYKIYSGDKLIAHQFLNGWHKYAIGQFQTYREAKKFKESCGVSGAFIVLFKNGEPIDISSL